MTVHVIVGAVMIVAEALSVAVSAAACVAACRYPLATPCTTARAVGVHVCPHVGKGLC